MTVAEQILSEQHPGDGSNDEFEFGFRIERADELVVTLVQDSSGESTVQTLTTHYTVSIDEDTDTGSVTMVTAPPVGYTLDLRPVYELLQPTRIRNQGRFLPEVHEAAFDRLTSFTQYLYRLVRRSIRLPDLSDAQSGELTPRSSWLDRFLYINAAGEVEPASGVTSQAFTKSNIRTALEDGGYGFGIHPLEQAALLTAADLTFGYAVGTLERYKLVGDGVTDNSAGWTRAAAASAQGVELLGTSGRTYAWNSEIVLTGQLRLNLHGATLKPIGAARFRRHAPAGTAVTTVSSGASIGSRQVVVANGTGLVVGQWVQIDADDAPTHDTGSYPSWWAKITAIGGGGTTITVDHPAPVTYSGTITFRAYTPSLILSRFECSNGRVDGSAVTNTGDAGLIFRIGGYEEVVFDNVTWKNCDDLGSSSPDLQIYVCIDVTLTRLRWEGGVHDLAANVADVQNVRSATAENCVFDGSHFAINLTRAETARGINNTFIGRRDKEGGSANSVRGLKFYGCATVICLGNYSCDYDSPLKVQACFAYDVSHNQVRNSAPSLAYDGSVSINIGSIIEGSNMRGGRVCFNTVENSFGVGIGISSDSVGGVLVQGNKTRLTKGMGIYVNVNNSTIIGNRVEDWGLRNSGDVGIWYSQGATVIGNRFNHSTLAGLSCLRNFLQATFKYHIEGNISETANPIGITLESSGTGTIASGATNTGAIAHGLSYPPNAAQFVLTFGGNPTNDPGIAYLSGIGGTNFQINVRSDPGASGASLGWRAKIQQPFTA